MIIKNNCSQKNNLKEISKIKLNRLDLSSNLFSNYYKIFFYFLMTTVHLKVNEISSIKNTFSSFLSTETFSTLWNGDKTHGDIQNKNDNIFRKKKFNFNFETFLNDKNESMKYLNESSFE